MAELSLSVISNNLANASTAGFKRDTLAFNETLERLLRADSGTGKEVGRLGSGPEPKGVYTIFEVGNIRPTGNPLDFSIATEPGMFAVQTPQGVKYTRNGSFGLNPLGQIVTSAGFPVLDESLSPIELPNGKAEVGRDGTIVVDNEEVAKIGVFKGEFTKDGFGLFNGEGQLMDEDETIVVQGSIEASNVNAIEEMIMMIKLNRAFEMAQKSATSQDESTQRLIQVLQN